MAAKSGEQITWTGTFTEAFQRALDVLGNMQAELVDADPGHGTISARTGPFSLGPEISIKMHTVEGVTTVQIEAHPAAPIPDLGASRRLVSRFLAEWSMLPLKPIDCVEE
jgi:hypothetical protein